MAGPFDIPPGAKVMSADDLYWEEVEQARQQSPGDKIKSAINLFTLGSELMRADIRSRHPDAGEVRILELLRQRLELGRTLEDSHE